MTAIVEMREVRAAYGKRVALDGVSVRVDDGITAVVGPNGGGKSTLLKVLATLLPPTSGELHVCGRSVATEGDRRQVRRSIGYLEQNASFPPEIRTVDCLRYAAWLLRVAPDERDSAVELALGNFDLLDVARVRIGRLSGGTRQRLMLAAACIHRPSLLVLDEPTAGVDPVHRLALQEMLRSAPARAVVVTTHHIDDIVAFADRTLVVAGGRIRFDGSLAALERLCGDAVDGSIESVQRALAAVGAMA